MNVDPQRVLLSVLVELRHSSVSPEKMFLLLRNRAQLDHIESIRLLRAVYELDLRAAKEVAVRASGLARSLDEYQGKLLEGLKLAGLDELRAH